MEFENDSKDWLLLCSGRDFRARGVQTNLRLEDLNRLHREGVLPATRIQVVKTYGSKLHNTMWMGTFLWIRSDLAGCLEANGVDLTLKRVYIEISVAGVNYLYYPVVDKMQRSVHISAFDLDKEIVYLKTKGYAPHVRGVTMSGDFSLPGQIAYDAAGVTGYIAIRRDVVSLLEACSAANIAIFEPSTYLFPTSRVPVLGEHEIPLEYPIMDYEQAIEALNLLHPHDKRKRPTVNA